MANIYAGTGYNQVISFNSTKKNKHIVYGPLCKNIVHSIAYNKEEDNIFYATDKSICMTFYDGSNSELIKAKGQ